MTELRRSSGASGSARAPGTERPCAPLPADQHGLWRSPTLLPAAGGSEGPRPAEMSPALGFAPSCFSREPRRGESGLSEPRAPQASVPLRLRCRRKPGQCQRVPETTSAQLRQGRALVTGARGACALPGWGPSRWKHGKQGPGQPGHGILAPGAPAASPPGPCARCCAPQPPNPWAPGPALPKPPGPAFLRLCLAHSASRLTLPGGPTGPSPGSCPPPRCCPSPWSPRAEGQVAGGRTTGPAAAGSESRRPGGVASA